MVRFLLALALGFQPVIGQFCGVQSSCASCVSVVGCVWNFGACLSSSSVSICGNANCINAIGLCPVLSNPVVYPTTTVLPPALPPVTLPPVTLPPVTLPPISGSASLAGSVSFPYSTTILPPLGSPLPPIGTPLLPSIGTPLLPSIGTPLYSSASVFSSPIVSASVATPIGTPLLSSPISPIYPAASASFAAPIYANAYTPPVSAGFSGGFYGGGGFYDNDNNGLFGGGGAIGNTVRADIYGNALEPFFPGIGGTFSTLNNLNLLSNAPDYLESTFTGEGYRRNPVNAFVRNDLFANALGNFIPGASGTLNAFNRFNLFSSLLG